jgi:D-sedoheptulose 7-phosphate isomerase
LTRHAPAAEGLARLDALLEERLSAGETFFTREAERLARLCHQMAERFARGGRLIALGRSPAARSDARHVAVEFVHPVIVGKRALPALGLAGEGGDLVAQLSLIAAADDIVMAFGADEDDGESARALALAARRGCLTIAFATAGAAEEFLPPSGDPYVRQELVETLYHVLWELVHVFFEHRGLLSGRDERPVHDAGASSFLYPFLGEQENELEPVIDDVRRSVLMKSAEIGELRTQTLGENAGVLAEAASALRATFERDGKLLALGNGGSATDAMDVVADFH